MSYKQERNPFNGPASFRNPKNVGTSNFNALEFEMPDLSQIYNKTADGDDKTVDITNESKTGSSNEGEQKETPPKSQTEITAEKARAADEPDFKDVLKEARQTKRDSRFTKSDELKDMNKLIKASTYSDAKKDRIDRREAKRIDKQINKLNKFKQQGRLDAGQEEALKQLQDNRQAAIDAKAEKENFDNLATTQIQNSFFNSPAPVNPNQSTVFTTDYDESQQTPQDIFGVQNTLPTFEVVAKKPKKKGVSMKKQINNHGMGFPMVNPVQKTDEYGNPIPPKGTMQNGGRPMNSNMLTNDPNNPLDPSKVSAQQENKAQEFAAMASSAGTPTPQYNPYKMQMNQNQPAFNEGFESLPEDVQRKIDPEGKADKAPAMINIHADGPAAYDGLSKVKGKKGTYLGDQKYTYKGKPIAGQDTGEIKKDGLFKRKYVEDLKTGEKMKLKDISMAPEMHSSNHAHTRVTKGNLKATERDDAAHMDYLKRDINYDAKHGGSKKQMLDDEKHISKLAGDLKYDVKHRGRKYDNV